jgi:hypothetical protein
MIVSVCKRDILLTTAPRVKFDRSKLQLLAIAIFLIIGSILRLLWAEDMEWKSEEQWMFEQARQIASGTIPLPISGMQSSVRIPNPGMSVWCFAAIAKFAHDPIAMVRWVQWLNVVTLWLFFAFVLWQIAKRQQAPWLWGLAIASVNPLAIVLSRKIWTPNILAPFCFLVFVGHWFRKKFWGSFLWGIAGVLMGQVQMGGFFLVIGLFAWTVWHHYRHKSLKETAWLGWFLGTAVGILPLIPWFWTVLPQMGGYSRSIVGLLIPKYYVQWPTTALGVNLSYALKKAFWFDFLREPLIFGVYTYLMVLAHLFLVVIGLYPLYTWYKSRKNSQKKDQKDSELSFYLKALGFGVGGAFTLSSISVAPYYMSVVFPFPYFWLARLYQHRIKILIAIALVQLFISFTFLTFIHRTGGITFAGSGYGTSYRFQMMKQN